ncbi:MAG: glucose-1-phosphate adenylyltransferase [Opitutales bacterium]
MNPQVLSIIMGGGRGTRLHPLTQQRSKPAVPLAGKYRLVDIPISNCLNSCLNRIYVLTQFNTASLHRHIQDSYKFDPFGGGFVDILSAEQTEDGDSWYQGTADAVRQNLHHFNDHPHDLVLILSGDQLYRIDFRDVIRQHIESKADITLAAKPVLASEVSGLGLMGVDNDLSVTGFAEKPKDPKVIEGLVMSEELESSLPHSSGEKRCLANMGIYVFNKNVLRECLQNDMADFGREVIPSLLGKSRLYSYIFDHYWEDIGTVHAFFEANLQLTDPLPPFNFFLCDAPIYTHARYLPSSKINQCTIDKAVVSDGCIVTEATIRRCVIGVRSLLQKGVDLENVVVMGADYFEAPEELENNRKEGRPDIGIGENSRIRNAIIDKNARIGKNVILSPEGKPDLYQSGGIVVRDGVLCVTKNAVIHDNTVI